jgi:hypothetical protein
MDNLINKLVSETASRLTGPKVIPNDPTPADQAIYVLSLTPQFATNIYNGDWGRSLPADMRNEDLNFLDPANRIFYAPHVMSSAGQALRDKNKGIITERDREKTLLICDSAGFQVANQTGGINDMNDREEILEWIEGRADVSMLLDIPTGPVGNTKKPYPFKTQVACRERTLEHLKFFERHHTPGKVTWLNVIQGNSAGACYDWYDAVKHFDCFEGWAIAGNMRKHFTYVLKLLLRMWKDGKLHTKKWIHVLGTQELWIAAMLTAVQRALNKNDCNLRISFDTSTPCSMVGRNEVFTMPQLSKHQLTLSTTKALDDNIFFDSKLRWPWPSAMGNRLTMGDICVPSNGASYYCRDDLSYALKMLHNYSATRETISLVNRIMDAQIASGEYLIAPTLAEALVVVKQVFDAGPIDGLVVLEENRTLLNKLDRKKLDEDDRC